MFEWDAARYFLALQRTGTLHAAAASLGVNQSTVGRRLAALEERLGARVFFRTRDGYRVTPAGERLMAHAERMEDEAHAIARAITGQESHLTGSIRITTPDELGPRVITPMLAELHARYPDIELEMDADDRVRSLSKREADMAVRVGRPLEQRVVARKMCDFTSTAYASRAYLDAHGTPRGGDLGGHALITFAEPLAHGREARWLDQHAPRGRVVFRSMSTSARIRAARAGMGIAVLPCYVGDEEPELVRLVSPADGVSSSVWLVVHRDLQHTARVRACADFLAERFRADAPRFVGGARRVPAVAAASAGRSDARRRGKTR